MSSRKITKKVVVKPVPAKKNNRPAASTAAPVAKTYVVSDEYGDRMGVYTHVYDVNEVLSNFEEEYNVVPFTAYEVSAEYSVSASKKYELTENKND